MGFLPVAPKFNVIEVFSLRSFHPTIVLNQTRKARPHNKTTFEEEPVIGTINRKQTSLGTLFRYSDNTESLM